MQMDNYVKSLVCCKNLHLNHLYMIESLYNKIFSKQMDWVLTIEDCRQNDRIMKDGRLKHFKAWGRPLCRIFEKKKKKTRWMIALIYKRVLNMFTWQFVCWGVKMLEINQSAWDILINVNDIYMYIDVIVLINCNSCSLRHVYILQTTDLDIIF